MTADGNLALELLGRAGLCAGRHRDRRGDREDFCDEFECYGWRRVRSELRHGGMTVNDKKNRRLMREHDLQPRRRRRYVATTDGDHDQPIYPNRAKDLAIDGPNQLWVADITYVAIAAGFA